MTRQLNDTVWGAAEVGSKLGVWEMHLAIEDDARRRQQKNTVYAKQT
jgi:hypothetical protein